MNQNDRILQFMDENGWITPIEAMKYLGIMRLAARIFDIRSKMGIPIEEETVFTQGLYGKVHYSKYRRLDNAKQDY